MAVIDRREYGRSMSAGKSKNPRRGERRLALMVGAAAMIVAAFAGARLFLADSAGAPGGPLYADPQDRELVRLGRSVYAQYCADCHGANLEGEANWRARLPDGTLPAPPHDETGHTWHHPDALLFRIVEQGGQAAAGDGFKSRMPAFGDSLTDREILASLAYIKSRWPTPIRDRHAEINAQSQ